MAPLSALEPMVPLLSMAVSPPPAFFTSIAMPSNVDRLGGKLPDAPYMAAPLLLVMVRLDATPPSIFSAVVDWLKVPPPVGSKTPLLFTVIPRPSRCIEGRPMTLELTVAPF